MANEVKQPKPEDVPSNDDRMKMGGALGKIAGAEIVDINIGNILAGHEHGNPREASQEKENAERIARLMKDAGGYDRSQPVLLEDKGDGKFLTLRGNGRVMASRLMGYASVPAIVLHDLSDSERRLIRADFGAAKSMPLSKIGEYFAVVDLLPSHLGQAAIAERLGLVDRDGKPRRSYVQDYVAVSGLPSKAREEFFKLWSKQETPIRQTDAKTLFAKYGEDGGRASGEDGGPAFQAAWAEIVARGTKQAGPRPMSKTELETVAKLPATSEASAKVLTAITTGDQGTLVETLGALSAGADIWARVSAHIGEDATRDLLAAVDAGLPVSFSVDKPASKAKGRKAAKV